jgi:hypothetical protein
MPGRDAGWVSYIRCMLLAAALQPIAGCQISPQWANSNLDSVQPAAVQEAQERARTYLACDKVTSEVLSRDPGDRRIGYGLNRSEFTIQTRGCHKQIVLKVACTVEASCSALAEGAIVEPISEKR